MKEQKEEGRKNFIRSSTLDLLLKKEIISKMKKIDYDRNRIDVGKIVEEKNRISSSEEHFHHFLLQSIFAYFSPFCSISSFL